MVSMQTFYTALADRTRRRILNLIREQEICVCFLTEVLEVSQPKISRHLAYLRNAEIVSARREGKWMYYRIVEPEDLFAGQILRDTLNWLKAEDRMQMDYQKLMLVCSSPNVPVTITRARKPNILPEADVSNISSATKDMETYLL
jgi:ArsR family transcriptional regulator